MIAYQGQSSFYSYAPVQCVHQSEYMGYYGFGDFWQFPALLVDLTDYNVV